MTAASIEFNAKAWKAYNPEKWADLNSPNTQLRELAEFCVRHEAVNTLGLCGDDIHKFCDAVFAA